MPWIGLRPGESVAYQNVSVRPWEDVRPEIDDEPLRSHLGLLVGMYHSRPTGELGGSQRGVGIVSVGKPGFHPLDEAEFLRVRAFRAAAFLAALFKSVHLSGPNAGHYIATTENFELVFQNFVVGRELMSEQSGTLVQLTNLGIRMSQSRITRPLFVPSPMRLEFDDELLWALSHPRRGQVRLRDRILRAAGAYCESFYNTPSLDVNARIMLQASAFEILLALKGRSSRKEFKDRIEALLAAPSDRRFAYKYRSHGKSHPDRRTVYGLWANHFYELRNAIIHGDRLRRKSYRFRNGAHHVLASKHIFCACVRALLRQSFAGAKKAPDFADRLFWGTSLADDEDALPGFRTERDWATLIHG